MMVPHWKPVWRRKILELEPSDGIGMNPQKCPESPRAEENVALGLSGIKVSSRLDSQRPRLAEVGEDRLFLSSASNEEQLLLAPNPQTQRV